MGRRITLPGRPFENAMCCHVLACTVVWCQRRRLNMVLKGLCLCHAASRHAAGWGARRPHGQTGIVRDCKGLNLDCKHHRPSQHNARPTICIELGRGMFQAAIIGMTSLRHVGDILSATWRTLGPFEGGDNSHPNHRVDATHIPNVWKALFSRLPHLQKLLLVSCQSVGCAWGSQNVYVLSQLWHGPFWPAWPVLSLATPQWARQLRLNPKPRQTRATARHTLAPNCLNLTALMHY